MAGLEAVHERRMLKMKDLGKAVALQLLQSLWKV
jgi:hypothetical protein